MRVRVRLAVLSTIGGGERADSGNTVHLERVGRLSCLLAHL